jgi:hypothetical protein
MDLNVKLQGSRYNFKKVQGCFCKITCAGDFCNYSNYFSKEKSHEIGPRYIDRVHDGWDYRVHRSH